MKRIRRRVKITVFLTVLSLILSCSHCNMEQEKADTHYFLLRFEPPACDCAVKYRALESGRNRSLIFYCDSFNVSYKINEFTPTMERLPISRNVMNYWSAEKTNLISYNLDSTIIYFRHNDMTDRTVVWRVDSSDYILGQNRILPSTRTTFDEQFDKIIQSYHLERTDTVFEPESLY